MKPRPEPPNLRYRWVRGGYRAGDVEQTLSALHVLVRWLEGELEELHARTAALEAELATARAELAAYRSRLPATEQALRDALQTAAAIEQVAHERARQIIAAAEAEGSPAAVTGVAASRGHDDSPEHSEVFESQLDLDAGPFAGSDDVSTFEGALARLACVDDVRLRSLVEGRATMELRLARPVRLVPLLRESLPYDLHVRAAEATRLVLDLRDRRA